MAQFADNPHINIEQMSAFRHTFNTRDLLRSRNFLFSSPELQNLSISTPDEWSPQWTPDEFDQEYFRVRRASKGTQEQFWSYTGDGPSLHRGDSDQSGDSDAEHADNESGPSTEMNSPRKYCGDTGCQTGWDSKSCLPASAVSKVPMEVIQDIFSYLHPRDFNAARHSCRSWMLSSLDRSLLTTMLQRGAWWSGAHAELWAHSNGPFSEEWLLSRHLARQCALSSGWTGNGVDKVSPQTTCALVKTAEIDFSELSHGYIGTGQKPAPSLIFAFSICGQYLMVAESSMIYIYTLEGGSISLLTNVVCPRKALAMSMDASEHRFAIAVLLEGRMGMVCDLKISPDICEHAPDVVPGDYVESSSGYRTRTGSSLFLSRLYPLDSRSTSVSQDATHMAVPPAFNTVNVRNSDMNSTLYETSNPEAHNENLINQTWNLHLHYLNHTRRCQRKHKHTLFCNHPGDRLPLENGPHTIYRHLCSEDDPPRSVAICPQRRCVAFGCSSGIELHWIDAQTGQDLQRWFPLSAPSDFLYFLNPRPGVDSARKLRIISSIAHPQDREGIRLRFFPEVSPNILAWDYRAVDRERRWYPGSTNPPHSVSIRGRNASQDYNNSPFSPSSPLSLSSTIPSTDHYRAVPLSDGYHHLFTDPISSALYLGSDAPLGGGVKLLRKIRFIPPATAVPRFFAPELLPPTAYAVGASLETGALVAAAYGSAIVLYNIPADVLLASRAETGRVECGIASCGCHDSTRRRSQGRSSGSDARGSSASAAADAETCQCESSCGSTRSRQPTWREWWDAESTSLLPGPQSPSSFLPSSDSSPRSSSSLLTPPQTPSGDVQPSGLTLPPYPHPSSPSSVAGGSTASSLEPLWPLVLHGTLLGHVDSVVDIAVNESPELTVWAISAKGQAVSWGIQSASKSPSDVDGEQRRFGCTSSASQKGKGRCFDAANGMTRSVIARDGRVVDAALLWNEKEFSVSIGEQPEWWDDELYGDDYEPGYDESDDYEGDDDEAPFPFDLPPTPGSGAAL
ncbi:uncharacterized protein BKA78DRAFT_292464 [Phyllosticta capitalensis]|uniref:uncharacterized protein n=1 Tax=Phyllosticta capitalensis TaxID=121624 RepID=UPI00312F7BFA